MRNKLKSLDILAPNINLNVAGRGSVQTLFGAFLSVVCTALFIFMTAFIVMNFFKTDNPTISEYVRVNNKYEKIDLVSEKLMPIIYFYLDEVIPMKVEDLSKYVTMRMTLLKYNTTTSSSGTQEAQTEYYPMEVRSCGSLIKEGAKYLRLPDPDDGYLYELSKNYGLCVKASDREATISGRLSDSLFEMAQLEILPCSLPSGCAPYEEVKRLSFIFASMKPTINLLNYSKPVKFDFYGDDYFYLNPDSTQRYNKKIMKNVIEDSRSYFFPTVVRKPFTTIERQITTSLSRSSQDLSCSAEQIKDLQCRPYFLFEYQAGGKTSTVIRSYKGIIETLGDVGGIREIVYTFFFFIYYFYNRSQAERLLVETVFNFNPGVKILKPQINKSSKIVAKQDDKQSVVLEKEPLPEQQTTDSEWSSAEAIPQTVFRDAVDLIDKKLDVVSIVKELQALDIIVKLLLKDYHQRLIPVVALNLKTTAKQDDRFFDRPDLASAPPVDQDSSHAQLKTAPVDAVRSRLTGDNGRKKLQSYYRELLSNHQTTIDLLSNIASPTVQVHRPAQDKSCLHSIQTDVDQLYVTALSEAAWLPFSKPVPKKRLESPARASRPVRSKQIYKIRNESSHSGQASAPNKKVAK